MDNIKKKISHYKIKAGMMSGSLVGHSKTLPNFRDKELVVQSRCDETGRKSK